MEEECWPTAGIAGCLPIDLSVVVAAQQARREGYDRRVEHDVARTMRNDLNGFGACARKRPLELSSVKRRSRCVLSVPQANRRCTISKHSHYDPDFDAILPRVMLNPKICLI